MCVCVWDHSLALGRPSYSLTAQGEIEMDRERVREGWKAGEKRICSLIWERCLLTGPSFCS